MSNLDAVNALLTAINFDRFDEIESLHSPDVVFSSFRGPTLHDNVSVEDWHRTFLRDYADCNYANLEYIEGGDNVAVRATIEAKGYDWRPFSQRVVELFTVADGLVSERRLYGMLRDVELDKPATAAMNNALESRGGSASATRGIVDGFFSAFLGADDDAAAGFLAEKAVLIDSVYGLANGPANIIALLRARPLPAFGRQRVTRVLAGEKDGLAEVAIDPSRPREAHWLRIVDGKVLVIESYWMLREVGIVEGDDVRQQRQIILPI